MIVEDNYSKPLAVGSDIDVQVFSTIVKSISNTRKTNPALHKILRDLWGKKADIYNPIISFRNIDETLTKPLGISYKTSTIGIMCSPISMQ